MWLKVMHCHTDLCLDENENFAKSTFSIARINECTSANKHTCTVPTYMESYISSVYSNLVLTHLNLLSCNLPPSAREKKRKLTIACRYAGSTGHARSGGCIENPFKVSYRPPLRRTFLRAVQHARGLSSCSFT